MSPEISRIVEKFKRGHLSRQNAVYMLSRQNLVPTSVTELLGEAPKEYIVVLNGGELVLKFESERAAMRWATEITEAQESLSCVVTTISEPFEIFWQKHRHMQKVKGFLKGQPCDPEQWHFSHPYVCVIHEPTKRGYYLNRNYEFICNVEHIIRPGGNNEDYVPWTLNRVVEHETQKQHRAASFTTPKWAEELPPTEFTTYWLY